MTSPIEGEVLAIDVSLGASVASGDPLFHVGNLDEVWLILDVYERNLAQVSVGASVSFTAEAYGGEVFTGSVDQIGGWLDPTSRTAEVRVVVPNPGHRLKPNMFAKARLALGNAEGGEGLVIPSDAVQDVEGRPSAFVEEVEEPGVYAVRPVKTEPLPDGRLRVLAGLEPGDRVVVEGAFTLKSELAKGELLASEEVGANAENLHRASQHCEAAPPRREPNRGERPGTRHNHYGTPPVSVSAIPTGEASPNRGTGRRSASDAEVAVPFAPISAINHSISLISRRWASRIPSASCLTRASSRVPERSPKMAPQLRAGGGVRAREQVLGLGGGPRQSVEHSTDTFHRRPFPSCWPTT